MTFEHKELDELDQVDWLGVVWKILLTIVTLAFGLFVLWYGITSMVYWGIVLGLLTLGFVIFMIIPTKNK